MNKKLLLAVMFTAMALGVKADPTTLTGRVVATKGAWSSSVVTYTLSDLYSELGYADAAAMKAALDAKEISITALNTEGAPVGGTNVGEGTQFTSNYTRTTTGVDEAGYNYGCFFMNGEGQVVGGWQYWKWNTDANEWQLVYGIFANHFDYDDTNIIIRLMQGNDGAAGIFTATITLSANDKSVVLESTLVVQATQESDLTIISEGSVYIQQTAHDANDWSSDYKWYWFDNSALLAAGATAEFITDNIATLLYTSDGTSLVNTHNTSGNGFWFKGSNETICVKATESMEFYVDHLICNNESWIGFYIGQGYGNLTAGQHRVAPLYIIYGNKAVKMNVVLDIAGYVFMDKGDNQTVFNKLNNQSDVTVYLSGRTLYKDGKWNTICLPFAVKSFTGTPLEGATVKELTSATFSDGTLTLNFSDDLTAIEEGKPYIIKWESGSNIVNPVFMGVSSTGVAASTISKDDGKVAFKGTYNAINYDAENKSVLFMGADNTLYYPQSGASIGACRAYFEVNSTGSLVKNFVLNFGEDEDRIDEVNCESVNSENTAIFNLAGQRLHKMQKGINIINGKKYIIK